MGTKRRIVRAVRRTRRRARPGMAQGPRRLRQTISVFDLPAQHRHVDNKIVAGLERLSQALRVLLWKKTKAHALSPIQIQFLVYLRYHPNEFCRVSRLARDFGLTQATVSDAVSALEAKGLLARSPSNEDGRVAVLQLTRPGERLAAGLSQWADVVADQLRAFPFEEKVRVMQLLMHLIARLQRVGIIAVARMCLSCRFFRRDAHPGAGAPHHCQLLDITLADASLRVDCPAHTPVRERG
jgi:DNA-binding MarR family transcriptional regulator